MVNIHQYRAVQPHEIMKLYNRRMQIERNFRDEKSEHFGFGLRSSYNRSAGRMLVLSLLATLRYGGNVVTRISR